jgi:hypothetical protein
LADIMSFFAHLTPSTAVVVALGRLAERIFDLPTGDVAERQPQLALPSKLVVETFGTVVDH